MPWPKTPRMVETHPQRDQILEDLLAGKSLASISRQYGISSSALCRYRSKVVAPKLAEVSKLASVAKTLQSVADSPQHEYSISVPNIEPIRATSAVLAADPFIRAIDRINSDRARIKGKAEADDKYSDWASLDRNDLSALELAAKLSGRLDSGAREQLQVAIVINGLPPASADADVIDLEPIEDDMVEIGR